MYTEIYKCRICENRNLLPVLNLGSQSFTGIFPKKINLSPYVKFFKMWSLIEVNEFKCE